MKQRIRHLFTILVVFYAGSLFGSQYNFGHLDYKNGLSHNHILCFAEDNNGFLWIGTRAGLNRYDGYNFKIFKHNPNDSTSIPNNFIQEITKDQLGRFWIKLPYETCIFNPVNEEFITDFSIVTEKNVYKNSSFENVIPYKDSIMFVRILGVGIIKHNIITNQSILIKTQNNDKQNVPLSDISHITIKNNLLYITYESGMIDILNADNLNLQKRITTISENSDYENILFESYIDDNNYIWVFCLNKALGLFRINTSDSLIHYSTTSSPALNSNNIACLLRAPDKNLWIGTDHGGINILNTQSNTIDYVTTDPFNENSLKQNVITDLYLGNDSIIWIGTFKQGINYYHKNIYRFWHYVNFPNSKNTLPYNDVNCFAEDKKGNLWIGTNGHGLIYFDRENNTYNTFRANTSDNNALQSDVIVSLFVDNGDNLWVGTYHGGLSSYNGNKFTNYLNNPEDKSSIGDNKVWDIFEDSHGNLWIGTLGGGLNMFDRKKHVFNHYSGTGINSLNSNFVMDITEDDEGNIWFATENGVFVLDFNSSRFIEYIHNPSDPHSLSDDFVYNIFNDSRGNIWAGSRNGLNLYNRKSNNFIPIEIEEPLNDNSIMSILESDNNNLWLGTSTGLIKFVAIFDDEGNYTNHYSVLFNESDGIQGREFNEGSAFKTSKGELIFGGPNGFNLFVPEINLQYTNNTSPKITGLEVFGHPVGINQKVNGKKLISSSLLNNSEITLSSGENMFSLKFVLIDFLTPKKIHYRYRMEGFNDQWIYTTWQNRKATFTNLSPGYYNFTVQSSDFTSDWKTSSASVEIKVLPPFYLTWYAYMIYAIIMLMVIIVLRNYIIVKTRNRYLKVQAREEANKQKELNELKTRFFTNISHEFRTPLTLILTPLDNLLKRDLDPNVIKHLKLIHQNAGRLLGLVNQLLDFRKVEGNKLSLDLTYGNIINLLRRTVENFRELSESKKIDLQFLSYEKDLFMQFDKDKIEKVINNLLSNAFKFTLEGGGIHVIAQLKQENNQENLIIKVMDLGIGIEKEHRDKLFERFYQVNLSRDFVTTGSGIGLSLTKEFVDLHEGTITVESEPGKGSCFTVSIPVNRERLAADEESKETDSITLNSKPKDNEQKLNTDKRTILLVEDNTEFRSYLKESLSDRYNILQAENGKEALNILNDNNPDLIVSDIMMPLMDGIQLCDTIKNNPEYSHIPVILLTAKSTHEDKVTGFKSGADEYITKPFDLDILESRISYLINLRQKFIKEYQKSLHIETNCSSITSLDEKLLNNILDKVNENISNPDFSVNTLSKELGISRVHLYKKTMSLAGKTPIELIRMVRLKRASELLLTGEYTVSEISYEVGFGDPRYFSKMFKNEFGVLPSKYRLHGEDNNADSTE